MRQRERRNGLNSLLVLIATCVLFFVLFAHQVRTRFIFQPGPPSYTADETIRFLETDNGSRLALSWFPVEGAKWTVLYLHGGSEDLGRAAQTLANYRLNGISAISFDYRGYGLSEGTSTEATTYADATLVYRYVLDTLQVDETRLILHGRGLGGAVAMRLAVDEDPRALVLESTFRSALRLYLPMFWMPGDAFDSQRWASRVDCPTLVIHGAADEVVPISHGQKLASVIGADDVRTFWVEGAGHDSLRQQAGGRYWTAIRRFFETL